jgi:hypothetical protein
MPKKWPPPPKPPVNDPFRTLDDPDPDLTKASSFLIAPGEIRAHAVRAHAHNWVLRFGRPNAWRRFWMRALMGGRWEKL